MQTSAEAETELSRAVNTKSRSGPIMVRSSLEKPRIFSKEVEISKSAANEAEAGEMGALRLFIRQIHTFLG